MFINIKNIKTEKLEYEKLEVKDIMLGAFDGDDRDIITKANGEIIVIKPRNDYLISEWREPKPIPAKQFEEKTLQPISEPLRQKINWYSENGK